MPINQETAAANQIRLCLIAAVAWCVSDGGAAFADVVRLSGGGQLEGTLSEDQERTTLTLLLEGGGRLTIDRDQVAAVSSESEALVEYRKRAPTAPDTVASQWALANWCKERRLRDAYRRHLGRVVELDPNHKEARALLGYRQQGGRWLTREQAMTARGMIRHEGDFRTRQEIALLERAERGKKTTAEWKDRLARWRRNLGSRDADRAAEALSGFESLNDRAAGPQLAKLLLSERDQAVKMLLLRSAARIPQGATVTALTSLALDDANEEIRYAALEQLVASKAAGLTQPFVRALGSKDNARVNRAAAALQELGAKATVAPLINALVTRHKIVPRQTAPGESTYSFRSDGAGGGGFQFGDNRPKPKNVDVSNPQVLSALVALTGENFGYDQPRWRAWMASLAVDSQVDLRRDF